MAASLASRNRLFLASVMVAVGFPGASRAHFLDGRSAGGLRPSPTVSAVRQALGRSPLPVLPRFRRPAPPPDLGAVQALALTLIMPPPTSIPTDVVRENNPNPPTVFTFGPPTRPPGFPTEPEGPAASDLPFVSTFTTPPSERSPEPATLVLGILGCGAVGLTSWMRRRRKGKGVQKSQGPKVEEPKSL